MFGEPEFQVTARSKPDGSAAIKVTAVRSYGKRSVSTSVEIDDEKLTAQTVALFEKAVKSVREDLVKRSAMEAAQAAYVAGQRGEEL